MHLVWEKTIMNKSKTNRNQRPIQHDGYMRLATAVIIAAIRALQQVRKKLEQDWLTTDEVVTLATEAMEVEEFLRDRDSPYHQMIRYRYPMLDEKIRRMLDEMT